MNFIINRRIFIAMIFTALSMLGYISYKQLAVELYPNAELPMLFVNISSQLEVDPSYMENQAVIPIEGVISTLEGIEEINSSAGSRQGTIQVSYSQSVNQKYAYLKLTEKIDKIKSNIPEEFTIQVLKFDLEQMNNMLMTLQVRGSGGVDRVRNITDKEIVEHIQNIDGIANAEVFGGREKSIEIILNEDVAKSYGITPGTIRTALSNNNKAREYAGKIIRNNRLHFVNVVAEFTDISEIHELEIRDGVKLKDVADIHYGLKKEESLSRVNGKESVTIQITRNSQTNIIKLSDAVKEKIDELNQKLGEQDIEIVIESNSAETIEDNIDLIIKLALTGGILAVFILWIFLKNLRLVAAIALAIPISVYASFNFFYAFGITINSLTLLGMALSIGMLLDNSVVVLENIYRLASQKMKPEKAVIQGTKEVWRSIFAATLTTITVFLPFLFSSNFAINLLGKHIGISIISTLLVSLLVALLLIPMITYVFLKIKQKTDRAYFDKIDPRNRLIQVYLVLLKTCMRYPARTILSAIGIFFVVLFISLATSTNTSQEAEITELTLYVTMPQGSTLEKTDELVTKTEEALAEVEEKKDIISQIYEEEAIINIKLLDDFYSINKRSVPQIKELTLNKLQHLREAEFSWEAPQTSGRFGNRGGGGGFGGGGGDSFARMLGIGSATESILIKGQDYDKMLLFAEELEYYLDDLSSIDYVNIGSSRKQPELIVDFDKDIMALYNVGAASISSGLSSFQSEVSTGVYFKQGNEEYEILIKTLGTKEEETEDRNLEDFKNMEVEGDQGSKFEVQNISEHYFSEGLANIQRKNQEKQIELTYRFLTEINDDKDLLDDARYEIDELVSNVKTPSGIAVEIIHEENQWDEFKLLFLMAIILIYMILASVFESFMAPFVMMFSIPLAAVGSMIALILTGNSLLNTNSLTGFLILLGIVVNNGIIMIDYARILERRGYNQRRALMMAGMARVRPILITAITTTIALIPLALGETEYVAQIGVPFAITVIGGLIVSTVLTLVFIPTLYSGLSGAIQWIKTQKPIWQIVYLASWLTGGVYVYFEVNNQIFQFIWYILLLILVPSAHYFIQRSLRKTDESII